MNSCKITYIYGLYEVGKEEEIRYVGKSDNPIRRLKDHRNDKRTTSYKSCWVKNVLSRGNSIGIKILKAVDVNEWKKEEIRIIREMRVNHKLVNLTDGGDGTMHNIYNKSYDECKLWIQENKPEWVKGLKEYKKWSKMDEFPDFLPKAPNRVYVDWYSWGDYLGTNSVSTIKRRDIYLHYEEAKKYLKDNFNLKNSVDFKKANLPIFIPSKPYNIYDSWKGWEDYLGYKSKNRKRNHHILDYDSAKKWIKENLPNITCKEYRNISKKGELPDFLPKKPEKRYENFIWADYLYHNGRKKHKNFYLKFKDAREITRKLGIKTNMEWRRWCKNKPDKFINIPSAPDYIYEEWISWFDWLGND